MAFHDLSFLEIACCPNTEERLVAVEPWLYSVADFLYPCICGTPILQPHIDQFLKEELWSVARACSEMNERDEIREWFFSRYGLMNVPQPAPMDTEIRAEGYPGFWESLALPQCVKDLVMTTSESMVLDILEGRHFSLGLDLGCGQGGMTQLMAESCRQVLGLETNFYLAAIANHLLKANDIPIQYFIPEKGSQTTRLKKKAVTNAQVICGNISTMPFCEPLFDWVHCGHVLDLMPDPAEVLIHIKRIMKPGSTLSICTPWDFEIEGHFDGMLEMLASDFQVIHQVDGIPWLRYNHKRRFILHEDWIWIGKLKNK